MIAILNVMVWINLFFAATTKICLLNQKRNNIDDLELFLLLCFRVARFNH